MKKSILFFAMIMMCVFTYAQNTYNVVIFSEDGEPFFVYANGIRQNDKPETNVKITNLTSEALSMRVQFDNKALPVLKQNFMPEFGYEHTVNIKKNLKKSMKLAYFGRVPLAEAPRTNAATVQYHTAENPMNQATIDPEPGVKNGSVDNNSTVNTSFSETQQVSTTATSQPGNISINMGPGGINMNVTTEEGTVRNSVTTTTYVGNNTVTTETVTIKGHTTPKTTTTTPKHANTSSHVTGTVAATGSSVIPRPINPNATVTSSLPVNAGCSGPMNDTDYETLKTTVDDTPFADNKLAMARAATRSNCLSVAQIKGITELMSTDDHRLNYAKFAYDYCTEKKNYYQVSEAFSFPSTTQKLNKFLQTK
jgi:hypothetical protein